MSEEFQAFRRRLSSIFAGTGGLDSWLSGDLPPRVEAALAGLGERSLSHSELDTLLMLSSQERMGEGFFDFYWGSVPEDHPYDVSCCGEYQTEWFTSGEREVCDEEHFRWGWTRFYVDALLYYGDVDEAYAGLRNLSIEELQDLFGANRVATESMQARGRRFDITPIPRDDRYLIAELACKTLEGDSPAIVDQLLEAYRRTNPNGIGRVEFKRLLEEVERTGAVTVTDVQYALDPMLELSMGNEDEIREVLSEHIATFQRARTTAIENTMLYVAMASELDVYMATSMRTRENFRDMAATCDYIFEHEDLRGLNVRYFDPTLSAASGHEDKGLVECLMVKSATALVYSAGDRDSWGKDAEAAMALSLGKPVVFYCSEDLRKHIFDDIHPLSRLISFESGVPVGAMVVSDRHDVVRILGRVFRNGMRYFLEPPEPGKQGHLRLVEEISQSTVRLQTRNPVPRQAIREVYGRPDLRAGAAMRSNQR